MKADKSTLPEEIAKLILSDAINFIKGFNDMKNGLQKQGEDLILNTSNVSIEKGLFEYIFALMYLIEQHIGSMYLNWKKTTDYAEELLMFRDDLFEYIILFFIRYFHNKEIKSGKLSIEDNRNEVINLYREKVKEYRKYKLFPKKEEGYANTFCWEISKNISKIITNGEEQLMIFVYTQKILMNTFSLLINKFINEVTILENIRS